MDVSLIILEKDNTPYLREHIVERPLWHVVVRNWSIELPSSPRGFHDRYVRIFDVFLDPVDGKPMKIRSRWPEGEPTMPPEPDEALAIKQMTRSGRERYHRFPDQAPDVSFVDALDSLQVGGASALIAKQIVADYVVWSKAGAWQELRAVWAITFRGVSPMRSDDMHTQTQLRYIVDAKTGEYLCGSNTPRPEKPRTDGE